MTRTDDITLDERDLVQRFLRHRGEQAFRALYRRHSPYLFELIFRLTRHDLEDAQDVHQNTWIRAVDGLGRFRWQSSLRTWLTGIAINCWRELRRGRPVFQLVGDEQLLEVPAPPGLSGEHHGVDLERAIARLPDGYREVLVLHDLEGYTHAEIATLLGIEVGTSKSQLHRARRAVRGWLNENRDLQERMENHDRPARMG